MRRGSATSLPLADVVQSVVDHVRLGLALVLLEFSLELRFGFVGILEKFRFGAEGEAANVAVSDARRGAHEADNLKVAFSHAVHHCSPRFLKSNRAFLQPGLFQACLGGVHCSQLSPG